MERGRYAARMTEGSNIIRLDPDIAEAFPDSRSVNDALRFLLDIAARVKSPSETSAIASRNQ